MSKCKVEFELKQRLRELRQRIRNGEEVHEEYNMTMYELQWLQSADREAVMA